MQADRRPFLKSPRDSCAQMTSPKMENQNISHDPKYSTTLSVTGKITRSSSAPMVLPQKEAATFTANAFCPSPRLAMG